jgi:hypothetical protein
VSRYFSRWTSTPQKPIPRVFEKNPKQVGLCLEEEYLWIKEMAKCEKAIIYWGDETSLRFDCNMISVITNQGRSNFVVFKRRFQSEVFQEFLRRLVSLSICWLFLTVDGHPVHCCQKTKK